ncbi:AraC family transcriptional regulator [Nocardia brasiliensis]|uniref:HTH-type transcriptional regulator RipA n=1 Tax=Nocardia brasiliensis (strain ATCC 700358 / HUJEG-1) TaxID=1133849 RepID=K0ESC2_NOCB7|nr:AraC family transcriptional regulator [Nocardia brasiliensis ATCC 700358]OCF85009.1 AraC family transcriptional regulator [Nocardia brasiliensis]
MPIFSQDSTVAKTLNGGARIDRHRHAEHQVVYPSSGVAEVRTDAGSWIAPADRAIWIPAGCAHEHHFYGPTRFHTVGFPFDLAPDWTTPSVIAAVPLVRELIITCSTSTDLPDDELVPLRRVLLDQLRRSPEQPLRLPAARDERLRKACALVESDLTEVWTLAGLGRQVGAAERTLTRLFRTELAMTYPQWRTQLRLHHAVQLLAERVPVTVVAHRCGWSSASAFIEVYRRSLGHTPGAYRPN